MLLTDPLSRLERRITACSRCLRLVDWRKQVAAEPPKRFRGEPYWAKPVPGFGDPDARILVVGLAPAANGANRTGRMFTGDRSGDWLYAALHRAGLASQAESTDRSDGLTLSGCWISAVVRCAPPANKPTTVERDECLPWLGQELALLGSVEVVICLGGFAWDGTLRALAARGAEVPTPRPRFGHESRAQVGGYELLGCYHPSQQNTFTGRLTEPMLDRIFEQANALVGD